MVGGRDRQETGGVDPVFGDLREGALDLEVGRASRLVVAARGDGEERLGSDFPV